MAAAGGPAEERGKNVPILQGDCELVRQEKGRAEWKRPSGLRFKGDLWRSDKAIETSGTQKQGSIPTRFHVSSDTAGSQ